MNIEELSKAQLILLTILVNFVTSVATGILTVSLLDKAPSVVTQTINRVVDRTIETVTKVVPSPAGSPAPSNQDLVISALANNSAHTAVIYDAAVGTSTPAVSVGTYIPEARVVVTAAREALPKEVLIGFSNNQYIRASLSRSGDGLMAYGFSEVAPLPKTSALTLIPSKDLKLGQTALAIGSDGSAATGIVSRVSATGVHTTLPDIGAGSSVVDISGNLIGIAVSSASPGLLINTEKITALLTSAPKAQ